MPSLNSLSNISQDLLQLIRGAKVYRKSGVNPDYVIHSLINLHCRTQGYSNDFLHSLLNLFNRAKPIAGSNGILGNLLQKDIDKIIGEINENGFYVSPNLLPENICDRLHDFALTTPSRPISQSGSTPETLIYNPHQPVSENYKFSEQVLLDNVDIQSLLFDRSILAIAQSYLGPQPILDIVTMWWSTAINHEASSEAAQLYHFDMDRIKWLKFFFYLTDVTEKNGPHCFVAKSHKRGGQPEHLLERGYARIADAEMEKYYSADAFKVITGPRGTIFIADTRGFHKGKLLEDGHRLIMQFEFCSNLFGAAYTMGELKSTYDPRLLDLAQKHKRIYSKFVCNF